MVKVDDDTTVKLPRYLVKRLKHQAIDENKSAKQLLTEILEKSLKENGDVTG